MPAIDAIVVILFVSSGWTCFIRALVLEDGRRSARSKLGKL